MLISAWRLIAYIAVVPLLAFIANRYMEMQDFPSAVVPSVLVVAAAVSINILTIRSQLCVMMHNLHEDISRNGYPDNRCAIFIRIGFKFREFGQHPSARVEIPVSSRSGVVGLCFRAESIVRIDDTHSNLYVPWRNNNDQFFISLGFLKHEIEKLPNDSRSYIAYPVQHRNSVTAVVLVRSPHPNYFDDETIATIKKSVQQIRSVLAAN